MREFYRRLPVAKDLVRTNDQIEALAERMMAIEHQTGLALDLQADEYRRRLLTERRYVDPRRLNLHEFQVFSQNGEDGVIAEIFRRAAPVSKTFIEVGVGDGLENCTTFLLSQGWKGWWVEADEAASASIRRHFHGAISDGRLQLVQAAVTAENVNNVLNEAGAPAEPDLLSLDIDRNTYWVWKGLASLRPRAVVVEYNGHFPAGVDWKVNYAPDRYWEGHTTYFGASLKAYELLGRELGYRLVGCELCGVNAFFVREDLCSEELFESPFTAEHHFEPIRPFLVRRAGYRPAFCDEG